jgi:hypothetical protein
VENLGRGCGNEVEKRVKSVNSNCYKALAAGLASSWERGSFAAFGEKLFGWIESVIP